MKEQDDEQSRLDRKNLSTPTVRQFTGSLPTVTVTDTRLPDQIPAGAGWYVRLKGSGPQRPACSSVRRLPSHPATTLRT
jgi:hypothetical protein